MRCPRCGKEYPSQYYFKTPTVCLECYGGLPEAEKAGIDVDVARLQEEKARSARHRSFGALVLRSVITLGIYYYYWIYVNLTELGGLSSQEDLQRCVRRGKTLFVLYLVLIGLGIFLAFSTAAQYMAAARYFHVPPRFVEVPPAAWLFLLLQVAVELSLYYYFSLAIVRGGALAGVGGGPVGKLYGWIAGAIALDVVLALLSASVDVRSPEWSYVRLLIPVALLGLGLLLTYLWRCQAALNRIWEQGAVG